MKNFLKKIPVYLTAVMVLFSVLFFSPIGASAVAVEKRLEPASVETYSVAYTVDGNYHRVPHLAVTYELEKGFVIPFDYVLKGSPIRFNSVENFIFLTVNIPGSGDSNYTYEDYCLGGTSLLNEALKSTGISLTFYFLNDIAPDVVGFYFYEDVDSIYYDAFDMFANYIYGEGIALTTEQNLVLTILATTAVLACVLLPFFACLAIARWCRL